MAYTKTNWVNGSAPALDADHLNKIEGQLELLANFMDNLPTNIQAGTISRDSIAANSYREVEVVFSPAFTNVPTVVVGLSANSTAGAVGSISVALISVTPTGFTCRIFNAGSSSRIPGANWIAVDL